jgi:hypothetical protein
VGLLSFSQIISLSLLNDKKKEEGRRKKKHGEVGGGNGREEEMEGRRRKKKKLSVLECRIILWVFFSLYDVADCDWGV